MDPNANRGPQRAHWEGIEMTERRQPLDNVLSWACLGYGLKTFIRQHPLACALGAGVVVGAGYISPKLGIWVTRDSARRKDKTDS